MKVNSQVTGLSLIQGKHGSALLKDEEKREPGNSILERLVEKGIDDVLGLVLRWLKGEEYMEISMVNKAIRKRMMEHGVFAEKVRIEIPIVRDAQQLEFELRMEKVHGEKLRYGADFKHPFWIPRSIKFVKDPFKRDSKGEVVLNCMGKQRLKVGFKARIEHNTNKYSHNIRNIDNRGHNQKVELILLKNEVRYAERLSLSNNNMIEQIKTAWKDSEAEEEVSTIFTNVKKLHMDHLLYPYGDESTNTKENLEQAFPNVVDFSYRVFYNSELPDFPGVERLGLGESGFATLITFPKKMPNLKCIELEGHFSHLSELPEELNFPIKVVLRNNESSEEYTVNSLEELRRTIVKTINLLDLESHWNPFMNWN